MTSCLAEISDGVLRRLILHSETEADAAAYTLHSSLAQ